ncbi:MAG: hypothetical protein H0W61_06925 [Bacteroidetes bacterium]|nr:hypothetical protein [Bacteroidota bacterium]
MKTFLKIIITLPFLCLLFASCGKGYEVRVTNYYVEDMDSVTVGDKLTFKDVLRPGSTEYEKLAMGTYSIKCVTKTKKRINSSITIPKRKSGKRTIQIDGMGTILVVTD